MAKTKTKNAGPVGIKPKGDYSASATYKFLDCVRFNHDSWICKALNADGTSKEITGIAPDDATYGALYWMAMTDSGQAAYAAATEAENVDASLDGLTVTITDRNGQSHSVNIGFEIADEHVYPSKAAMVADAANVLKGQFCMVATVDPTSQDNASLWSRNALPATAEEPFTFLSDLDQASMSALADWMQNYRPMMDSDHTRAESDHTASVQATSAANSEANRAKAYNDHPWEIRADGYIWVWDETTSAMVRTNKMIINFDDLTEEQKEAIAEAFYDSLVIASEQTCEDIIDELV